MKRIMILTLYDWMNYGNRLQNYAVQEILTQLGFQVETLRFEKSPLGFKNGLKYILQRCSGYRLPGDKGFWRELYPQRLSIEKFNKQYIRTKNVSPRRLSRYADYFVTGSDQVWNAKFYDGVEWKSRLFLLTFAERQKRVCLAPSFGGEEIPEKWKPFFQKHLNGFPYLSVRERAGADIIRKLTGREAEVLIDPTLMLDKEKWNRHAVCPLGLKFDRRYIFTYFLGGMNQEQERYCRKLALKYKMRVYHFEDRKSPYLYAMGPSEFLYMIRHAALILTDSFHGCVFSFLFERPFQVFQRNGEADYMFSRLENFLDVFSLKRKYFDSGLPNELFECDYRAGIQQLAKEREKEYAYLKKVLSL